MKPEWFDRDIIATPTRETDIAALKHVQRILRCDPTGIMDDPTKLHIRGLQSMFKLRITGAVDEATATVIDSLRHQATVEKD